jgi:hypothetical protein
MARRLERHLADEASGGLGHKRLKTLLSAMSELVGGTSCHSECQSVTRSPILCGHPWSGVGPILQSGRRPGRPCHARDPPPNSGVHNHA